MRTTILAALLPLVCAATAQCEELAKVKIAVVRFNRLMNNEVVGYEQMRTLIADKETLEALRKVNADLKTAQKDIVAAEDDAQMNELGRRYEFLNRKRQLLRQRMQNESGRDMQKVMRDFVVSSYKDKYHLIVQEPELLDRMLWKGNADIVDITDEVAAKVKEYAAGAAGE